MQETLEDGYILERTAAEYERLRAQSRALGEATERVLAKAGLGRGMTCLDVGCGPGEVMRLMAARAGEAARIVGLDIDRTLGEHMLAQLRAEVAGNFDFVAGDLLAEDTLPDARFNFVFARLVLVHMADPEAALRRLWGWVAPGGTLVAMDYDMHAIGGFPSRPAMARAAEIVVRTFAAMGKRPDMGSWLPHLFCETGIGPPMGTDLSGLLLPAAVGMPMAMAVLRSLSVPAAATGVSDAAEIERILGEMEALGHEPDVYFRWPLIMGVWARRPV